MTASYDSVLVVLSVFIGMSSAYGAADLAGRVNGTSGLARFAWLIGGAVAVGIGFWAMHFTGMMAFSLPVPVAYDWPTVSLSLMVGIVAAGSSIFILSRDHPMSFILLLSGSVIVGTAIITMHYVGMCAMRAAAQLRYDPGLISMAIILAILIPLVAFRFGFHFRHETWRDDWRIVAGALAAGAAISSVHYCAMAAANFSASASSPDVSHATRISMLGAVAIAMATLILQGLAVLTSLADRRLATQKVKLLLSQLAQSQEIERRRIARDLHDDLGQDLYAARLNLRQVQTYVPNDEGQKLLSEAMDLIVAAMEKVRTTSQLLHPPELETLGLRSAIVVYVEGFRERSSIEVDMDIPGAIPRLCSQAESALLKVVQECLLNIVRHSGSRKAHIRILSEMDQLSVEVIDEGRGIRPEVLNKLNSGAYPGVGLAAMSSRIEELDGRLEIDSGPSGTSVKAVIPVAL
jgi:signal transduction histidine kinase